MADLKTEDIRGVELARVGKWHGGDLRGRQQVLDITAEDLAAAVEAYEYALAEGGPADAEAPIKIGHMMAQEVLGDLADRMGDGTPAYGWVGNLRLTEDGTRLVGDYLRVPAKVASLVKSGAWRHRSIEFGRNLKWPYKADGGKPFRMVLTAVALLGATAPAIKGLADIFGASEPEGDDAERFYLAEQADEPISEADLKKLLAEVRAFIADKLEPHFRGRAGAPMARALFDSFEAQITRAARFVKPTPQEGQMRAAVLAMLGLSEDATNEAALAALSKASTEAAGGLYTLALNADAALAVLAEILGVPGATPDDVIAKVRELTGGAPAEGGDPAAPPPEGAMSNPTTDARIAALEKQVAEAKAEAARATVTLAKRDAEAKADRDIAANSLPASIRETLVTLAQRGDEALYASVVETSQRVPTKEKGRSDGDDAGEEPSDDAVRAAMTMGMTREGALALLRTAPVEA